MSKYLSHSETLFNPQHIDDIGKNISLGLECDKRYFSYYKTLRKHAYSNILKILQPKTGKFSDKKFLYFSYFCSKHRLWFSLEPPRRGGSNAYHNLCFRAEIRKIMFTPVNPSFPV